MTTVKESPGIQPNNLLCFSPFRWDNVLQRPHHLLLRFSEQKNVYFFEEPVFDAAEGSFLDYATRSETLWKVVPHLPPGLTSAQTISALALLMDQLLQDTSLSKWIFWYYTPYALSFTANYRPKLIVYDQLERSLIPLSIYQRTNVPERKLLHHADLTLRGRRLPEETPEKWDCLYKEIALSLMNAVSGNADR